MMHILVGLFVISLFHTVNSQATVNCTGFVPLEGTIITPEADQTRMMNLMKVIYNPNSTLTQDQKQVMAADVISTLSCETQFKIEQARQEQLARNPNLHPAEDQTY